MGNALKKKQDEKAKEIWVGVEPPATQCRKCMHAYADIKIDKNNIIKGACNAYCEMYQPPEDKENGILEDKIECKFFEEK